MSYQIGSEMLFKVDAGNVGSFVTAAGVQTTRFSIRTGEAEVTNQSSPDKWRELLQGAGIKSVSASGDGPFDSVAPSAAIIGIAMNNLIRPWQVIVPGLGTFQGLYQLTQVELQGKHSGEVSFSWQLESAGQITFTAQS